MTGLQRQLVTVILIAAVAEATLLRVALRLGPVLPTRVDVLPIFAVVEKLGVAALNVGVLAAILLLAITAWDALRRGSAGLPLALALVGSILVNLGLQPMIATFPSGPVGLLHGAVTGAAVLLVALSARQPSGVRMALAAIGLAHGFALAQSAEIQAVWGDGEAGAGWSPSVAAEIAAVAAALVLPWACRIRPRTREIVGVAAAGLVITAMGWLQPWGLATLAIWTLAFSLFLPPVVYGAAVASILVTGLALRRQPGGTELAIGLTVIWLAGLKLDVSTFALMALAGLTIASFPEQRLEIVEDGTVRSKRWRPTAELTRMVQ
jgi:hypothetical protein